MLNWERGYAEDISWAGCGVVDGFCQCEDDILIVMGF